MIKYLSISFLATLLLSFTGKDTPFQGIITYSVKVESIDPLIKTASFEKITGTELKIYVKGASIRAVCNGTSKASSVIVQKNHAILTTQKLGNDAAALFLKENTLFAIQPNKEEIILNKKCYQLSCDVKSEFPDTYLKKDYFLCESCIMDKSPFAGNKSALSMYKALEKGNLPLKMIFEGAAYKVTYVATSIEEKELHDSVLDPDQN